MKRVVVEYGQPFCTLRRGDAGLILPALKVRDPSAPFRRARAGAWGAAISDDVVFFDWEDDLFPAGLLEHVQRHCHDAGVRCVVRYPEGKPDPVTLDGVHADMLFGVSMSDKFDYQLECVKAAIQQERGRLWLATNAGKSVLIAAIVLHLWRVKHVRSLVLVPNTGLLFQLSKDIRSMLGGEARIGVVGGGKRQDGDVIVSTAQTAIRGVPRGKRRADPWLADMLARTGCIVVDEGHHSSAVTWQSLLTAVPARFRYAMSGTMKDASDPVKDFTLHAYLGPIIKRVRNSELMRRGVSARAYVFCVTSDEAFCTDCLSPRFERYADGSYVLDSQGNRKRRPGEVRYREEQDKLLADKHYNSAVVAIAKAFANGGLKPLVLTSRISHLRCLSDLLKAQDMRPLSVWGDVPAEDRLKAVRTFTHDSNSVLLGSSVLDEGFNAPAVGVLMLVSGGKSSRQTLQRVGRAVRAKKHGLNVVAIVDMAAHNGEYLAKHTLRRLDIYRGEGFRIFDASSVSGLCEKARQGWRGLLGEKRYTEALQEASARSG